MYSFDGERLRAAAVAAARPLRWAAWRPDGAWALVVGNRGEAARYDGERYERLATQSAHNLRGAAWSPDGSRALLCGNRGAVLLFDGDQFIELPAATTENLRRAAWSPDGRCALVVGNAGTVLRFDALTGMLTPLPGDRAHTLRSIAWQPDGAYTLIGAYASSYAGYPRPHMLYRCDGRYTQALLATDDDDDAVAISWRRQDGRDEALILSVAYAPAGGAARAVNKLMSYDGHGFATRTIDAPGALLGAGWRPGGADAVLCGEGGALLRYDGARAEPLASGTQDNLVGPFWRPDGSLALFIKGPDEKVYTA